MRFRSQLPDVFLVKRKYAVPYAAHIKKVSGCDPVSLPLVYYDYSYYYSY